jgi:hypothetical protein
MKFGRRIKADADKRTQQIMLKCTPAERQAIYEAAVSSKITVSDLLRAIIFKKPKEKDYED